MKFAHYTVVVICMLSLVACENYKGDYDKMMNENAALQQRLNSLEEEDKLVRGEYSDAIETLNAIEDTLRSISNREKEIQRLSQQKEFSGKLSQKQAIIAKLQALRDANEDSKNEAKRMQSKVRSYQIENEQLKKMISQAESKIMEKEGQLEEANSIIGDMERALSKLEVQLSEKSGELADAYEDLKTQNGHLESTNSKLKATISELSNKTNFIDQQAKGYVACGGKQTLRQQGILSKTSLKKLTKTYQKAVKAHGSQVDYFQENEINCDADDGEIISVLPERDPSSYTLEGTVLVIKDQKTFWATDKVVVLVKK